MNLTIDFETRSECPLKDTGMWVYFEHPSTEIMCCAVKADDEPAGIWIAEPFWFSADPYGIKGVIIGDNRLQSLILQADTIEAHNAGFERSGYEQVFVKRFGWPPIPTSKWRCSMAKCYAAGLPGSLDKACEELNLPVKKDKEGYFNMMKMCKPRKPTKKDNSKWNETPEQLGKLFNYCIKDVEAEHCLSQAVPEMSDMELKIWQMDQEINARGIQIDVVGAGNAVKMIEEGNEVLLKEFLELTGLKPTQSVKFVDWVNKEMEVL